MGFPLNQTIFSTISSGLNALAAVALKDFVSPRMRQNLGEHKQALLTKVFSVLFGVLCYSGTFVIRYCCLICLFKNFLDK